MGLTSNEGLFSMTLETMIDNGTTMRVIPINETPTENPQVFLTFLTIENYEKARGETQILSLNDLNALITMLETAREHLKT